MRTRKDLAFRPKKLGADDLRAPITANLRRLPPAIRDELHAGRRRLIQRIHPWGPTRREERRRSILVGAVALPLACVFLSPLPAAGLAWMVPLGGVYGLLVCELKPLPLVSGLALLGLVALAHGLTGTPLLLPPGQAGVGAGIYFLLAVCRLLLLFCLGMMLMIGRSHVGE